MGSSCDDGLKNADVVENIDGSLSRFSPSYDAPADYADEGSPRSSRGFSSQALIERTVESSVLSALLRRHGILHPPAMAADRATDRVPPPAQTDFDRFLEMIEEGDVRGALAWLTPWRHPFGLLDDRIAGLLAQAAQRLGRAWENDRLCFAEVSLGLVTLQRVLHEFAPPFTRPSLSERRMLLVPMPGETHSFGLRMLGIRFQQAGWDCHFEAVMTEDQLLARLKEERFDVLGLSVHNAEGRNMAPGLIGKARAASREKRLCVLLGGAYFAGNPAEAGMLGADLPSLPFRELCDALDGLIPSAGT